jgi:hypothetical protein
MKSLKTYFNRLTSAYQSEARQYKRLEKTFRIFEIFGPCKIERVFRT